MAVPIHVQLGFAFRCKRESKEKQMAGKREFVYAAMF